MQHQACALRPPQPQENPDGSLSSGETGESVRVESEKDDEGRVVRMSVTFIKDNTDKTSAQVGDVPWMAKCVVLICKEHDFLSTVEGHYTGVHTILLNSVRLRVVMHVKSRVSLQFFIEDDFFFFYLSFSLEQTSIEAGKTQL